MKPAAKKQLAAGAAEVAAAEAKVWNLSVRYYRRPNPRLRRQVIQAGRTLNKTRTRAYLSFLAVL